MYLLCMCVLEYGESMRVYGVHVEVRGQPLLSYHVGLCHQSQLVRLDRYLLLLSHLAGLRTAFESIF